MSLRLFLLYSNCIPSLISDTDISLSKLTKEGSMGLTLTDDISWRKGLCLSRLVAIGVISGATILLFLGFSPRCLYATTYDLSLRYFRAHAMTSALVTFSRRSSKVISSAQSVRFMNELTYCMARLRFDSSERILESLKLATAALIRSSSKSPALSLAISWRPSSLTSSRVCPSLGYPMKRKSL